MDPTTRALLWRTYWLATAAVAGAVVLGLEVLAARTLAPAVGAGPVAWSALLAGALGALAAGNLIGGFLAARGERMARDAHRWHAAAIAWALWGAAASTTLFAWICPGVMRWAADAELLTGALAASIMSQGLPVGLLGLLTPMLLRAGNPSPNEAISDSAVGGAPGRWSGAVLAAGGAGGIAGALGMGLWLIPSLGLSRSYGVLSAALLILLAPAAAAERRWALGVASALLTAALIAGWGRGGVASSESTRIIQSTHGQLDIRRVGGRRTLLIDGLPQTALDGPVVPGEALRHGCLLEAALTGFRPRQALVIGLGAGLAPRVLAAHGVPCESVELDARVAEVAREAFGFDGPVTIADGRSFLARDPRRWDLIVLDVCTAERLAWHLFTIEAFRLVRARLAPEGRLAIQFITAGEGDWPASLARTVEEVFGRGVILEPAASLVPVMPCWLLAGWLPPAPPPDARTDPTVPWRVRPWPAGGARLTDDHFAAERDWSRTAHCWRRLYGQRPGGP